MSKRIRKRKGFRPKKLVFAGSSNTVKLENLIEFVIKPDNRSKPGASALLCRNNNYCTQIAPPNRDTLYVLFLSFNHILRFENQLATFQRDFQKRILQTLTTLRSFGLKKEQVIIYTPLPRFNQTTWTPQLKECTKLQQKLSELNYQCIDTFAEIPKDIVNSEFFCTRKRDDTHYSRRTLVALAQATNNAIIKKLGIKTENDINEFILRFKGTTVKKHVF